MNNEEAKFILQAYRSGGQDADDPQFREALAQAQRDPELGRWFAHEQALDARIGAKLERALTPPADLKTQLLAQRKIVRPIVWWQRPTGRYALAAGFALLATLAVMWFKVIGPNEFHARGAGFAGYRESVTDFTANKLWRLDFKSRDVATVRKWLAENHGTTELVLPTGLEERPSLGCRVLDWQGHKVTLVCFDLANQTKVHLLVVDRSAFTDAPGETPVYETLDNAATASWSRGGKTYVVCSKGDRPEELLKLLAPPPDVSSRPGA